MTGILERMNVKPRCVNQSVLDALAIKGKDFYILLAVHSNIMIVHFYYQLGAQILYFNTFITLLYMFRVLLCPSSGGQLY